MKKVLSLLSFLPFLLACQEQEALSDFSDPPQSFNNSPASYLALGDSYTIGTAIGANNSYAHLLADSLFKQALIDSLDFKVVAQNGWTTGDLLKGLDSADLASEYSFISLLIGVNNQYQKGTLPVYRQELGEILTRCLNLVQNDPDRIVVLSIPDYGVSPAGRGDRMRIAQEIDEFNAEKRRICDSLNIRFVPITEISRQGLNRPELIANDGLHFSAQMHELWLYALWPVVKTEIMPHLIALKPQ
jgi:lysophospholipase L1-like esterase